MVLDESVRCQLLIPEVDEQVVYQMRRMGLGHLITELSVEMPPTTEEGSCMSGKPLATPDTAYSESRDEGYLNKIVLLVAHVAWERQAPKEYVRGASATTRAEPYITH